MVKKDFKCDNCRKVFEMEIPMNQTECKCPECDKNMDRVFDKNLFSAWVHASPGSYGGSWV